MRSNSVPNLNESDQSAAELQRFKNRKFGGIRQLAFDPEYIPRLHNAPACKWNFNIIVQCEAELSMIQPIFMTRFQEGSFCNSGFSEFESDPYLCTCPRSYCSLCHVNLYVLLLLYFLSFYHVTVVFLYNLSTFYSTAPLNPCKGRLYKFSWRRWWWRQRDEQGAHCNSSNMGSSPAFRVITVVLYMMRWRTSSQSNWRRSHGVAWH